MKNIFLLLAITGLGPAASIDVGTDELPMNKPFCGDCYQNLRYQVLLLDSDVGTAATIGSISFKRSPIGGEGYVEFDLFRIYVARCNADQLSEQFDQNWIDGTRVLVYDHSDVTITAGGTDEWFEVPFDTPYFFPGADNLLIEFEWAGGAHSIYNWGWNAGTARSVTGGYGDEWGSAETEIPHFLVNGTLDLAPSTFGALKASAGDWRAGGQQ